jgi:hypothetical protein
MTVRALLTLLIVACAPAPAPAPAPSPNAASTLRGPSDTASDASPVSDTNVPTTDSGDSGVVPTTDPDGDGDGWLPPDDCDDTRASVYPGAVEIDGDGLDGDCDGVERCWIDADDDESPSDVLGPPGDADCDDPFEQPLIDVFDCDDDNYNKWPGAPETAGDGVDDDCDGVDACHVDLDGDGYFVADTPPVRGDDLLCDDVGEAPPGATPLDCDDLDPTVYGGAPEVELGIDKNCDGFVQCRRDADVDGFAPNPSPIIARYLVCDDGYTTGPTSDCDDFAAARYPGAEELVADRVDSDCDGLEKCWVDADGDRVSGGEVVLSSSIRCTAVGVVSDPAFDCDDRDASVGAGPPEAPGNDVDEDCDGITLCYVDEDDDGHVPVSAPTAPSADGDCADPGEGEASDPRDDCAPTDPAIPGVDVPGEGIDRDCDGFSSCYADRDGDGASGTVVRDLGQRGCNAFEGESIVATDCDDTSALVSPLAQERPGDGVDNNCDGAEACYVDDDGDRVGTDAVRVGAIGCAAPGLASRKGDCRDDDAAINPDAEDVPADGVDGNCDGRERCFTDADGDGASLPDADLLSADLDCDDDGEGTGAAVDCDDTNPRLNPFVPEISADGIDQDCDGQDACQRDGDGDGLPGPDQLPTADADCDDEGEAYPWVFPDCDDADPGVTFQCASLVCYADLDRDGFGTAPVLPRAETCLPANQQAAVDGDCDDREPDSWPGNTEIVGNDLDDDCDGAERCYRDDDADGYGVTAFVQDRGDRICDDPGEARVDGDCDDDQPLSFPFNRETPGDGVDGNCDGFENCFSDEDRDGVGSPRLRLSADWTCTLDGTSARADDCVDDDPTRSPLATETPGNNLDEDCSGSVTCYEDADRDGHGTPFLVDRPLLCDDGGSLVADDCDDASPAISPSAAETIGDGLDQDCDGKEACYRDLDGDGVGGGDPVPSDDLDCADDGETASEPASPDCDDERADVRPGAREQVGDGVDSNCDGLELCLADADDDTWGDAAGATATSAALDCFGEGVVPNALTGDCDDTDPDRYPDAPERADATEDMDCDGRLPEDVVSTDPDADPTDPASTDVEVGGTDVDDPDAPDTGCGCASSRGAGGGWVLALAVLARRRR